jgi:hypothetical protein
MQQKQKISHQHDNLAQTIAFKEKKAHRVIYTKHPVLTS